MSKMFRIPLIGRTLAGALIKDRHGSATRVSIGGSMGYDTNLTAKVIRDADYKLADGRTVNAKDLRNYSAIELEGKQIIEGTGYEVKVKDYFYNNKFQKLWHSALYRNKTELDLGSGLTTNVGSLGIANEFNWANPSGAVNTVLALAKYHATGTGATAAAATDIKIQTISTQGGQTPVAGTQVLSSAANAQKYQTVATISYTGSEAVTEWGLFTGSTLTATTGSPFTAVTATTGTVTGTPLTASSSTVAGSQLNVIEAGTTASWGLVLSNTTSQFTFPAWYKTADGTAGTTPGNTETYTIRPILWDHKQFSAINVNNGDSIQFTYTLTINSGG